MKGIVIFFCVLGILGMVTPILGAIVVGILETLKKNNNK